MAPTHSLSQVVAGLSEAQVDENGAPYLYPEYGAARLEAIGFSDGPRKT